ncbi:MAG: hypothetical protein HY726_23210 [Candidatus Rokubacteria bacterium]|nr:hypothetical protein [Candidatus Rokubacteria bacterium]
MTLDGLTWIVVVNGLVQLAGLITLVILAVRGLRAAGEISRMTRAVAGLVIQEEEKTRALLKELLSREPGRA